MFAFSYPSKNVCILLQTFAAFEYNGDMEFGVKKGSLVSRLRLDLEKDKDFVPLPGPLLCKYIAYARNFIFPK